MKILKTYIIFLSIIVISCSCFAQVPADTVNSLPGIEIVTSVDRSEVYIGDLINYKIEIIYDSTYEYLPSPLGANLGGFDVKDYQQDKNSILPDGRKKTESVFSLSTFTTGEYIIPPVPVGFMLPDSTQKVMFSESVPINVKSMLENAGDSVDIKPLKQQYEFEFDWTQYIIWGTVAFFVLLLGGYFLYRKFRSKDEQEEILDKRPPWEIAFEQMVLLKQKGLLEQNLFKQYYIELTEISRTYLGKMFQVNVIDMTTEEFLESFVDISLPHDLFDRNKTFLQYADLIKFAKLKPENDRMNRDYDFVYELIELIRVDYEKKQQAELQKSKQPKNKVEVGGSDG
ncbi:MAG: hypothetical protein DRP35_06825 [Candidatus Zixiibacteriota bacterium]|nr:MAG: hypothetical protein DRP35_06825 [candidate division Zixibacteria bacterium]